MNKSHKILALVPAAMMLALTSCGDKPTDTQPSPTSTGGDVTTPTVGHFKEKVSIEFKSTFSYQDQIENLIASFNEIEPNVEVTYTKFSGSYSTLKTQIISDIGANSLPNITSCYPDHIAEYLDYDIVCNLAKYMDSDEDYAWTEDDYADVLPSLMKQTNNFARKGTYMLPHSSSTEAMFYNEGILNKTFEGCNDGNPITAEYLNNITWEELMGKLAPAILKENAANGNAWFDASSEGKGAIVAYSGSDNAFVTLTEEKGVTFSSIDKSTGNGELHFADDRVMKNTLKDFNGYFKGDLFTTAALESETNLNVNEKKYSVFATGSTGGIKYQVPSDASFSTGVMRIPNFEGQPHKVISQGPGICALKTGTADQQLASYLFMNFLTQTENTLYWALETGYLPVRSSAYDLADYVDACDTAGKDPATLELLKAKVYSYANTVQDDFFTNAPFKGSDSARSLCGSLLDTVVGYSGELTDEILDAKFNETIEAIKLKM